MYVVNPHVCIGPIYTMYTYELFVNDDLQCEIIIILVIDNVIHP